MYAAQVKNLLLGLRSEGPRPGSVRKVQGVLLALGSGGTHPGQVAKVLLRRLRTYC